MAMTGTEQGRQYTTSIALVNCDNPSMLVEIVRNISTPDIAPSDDGNYGVDGLFKEDM